MSLEIFGRLYDILAQSGIVAVALVANEKSTGLEITYLDGSVEQKLVTPIIIKEADKAGEPKEKKEETPIAKT